jgi:hypothetical protein
MPDLNLAITVDRHLTADLIAALLNEMLVVDPAATHALLANRVPCNYALSEHPTVQVGMAVYGYTRSWNVGLLGVLNGLAGCDRRVVAVFDEHTHTPLRFEARDFPTE